MRTTRFRPIEALVELFAANVIFVGLLQARKVRANALSCLLLRSRKAITSKM